MLRHELKNKLRRVSTQADVQRPGDFYAISEESDESILKKALGQGARGVPTTGWHVATLRFKCIVSTAVDAFEFLALLVDETQWAERGACMKVDLKKFSSPRSSDGDSSAAT